MIEKLLLCYYIIIGMIIRIGPLPTDDQEMAPFSKRGGVVCCV